MFGFSEEQKIDRPTLKCEHSPYTLQAILGANRVTEQFFIDIPRRDSVIILEKVSAKRFSCNTSEL